MWYWNRYGLIMIIFKWCLYFSSVHAGNKRLQEMMGKFRWSQALAIYLFYSLFNWVKLSTICAGQARIFP